jgi:asparagine synthase (glutamine-hydrolysing)
MCGILFTSDGTVSESAFRNALNMLNHRGPDASGYIRTGNYQLGHKRLKIIDLDNRSNQPFYSRDGRYALIFNGEIYNYRVLAREYGIEQHTTSDTEVIVELYARYGSQMLAWLNGMFAFVIFDTQTREVFVARDRLGVKPLYMRKVDDRLTLASEIAPILELFNISTFDNVGLRQYRKLRACFNGRTVYKGVEMFPAGHYMLGGKLHRYWQLPENPQEPPTDAELRHLIVESVRQRLISDVPVGSFLSGGLDSTIVAALAQKPHTWTIGFAEQNEFEWGRLAAEHIHSIHHEVMINPEEFVVLCRDMIRKRREPLSVPNEVMLYKMTCEVKKENTVILSGEGADELFFGYDRIFRWAASVREWDLAAFARLYSYGSHDDLEIVEDALEPFLHRKNPVEIVAHFFQVAHLHGLLRRLDNSTMLCSVEARVPFVDYHPLIERLAGVPFDYRMENGEVKSPLKRVFQELVPQAIINRKKVGFPVPLASIPFGKITAATPMDQWLEFNLSELCGTRVRTAELMKGAQS